MPILLNPFAHGAVSSAVPSYANPGGTGDRQSIITASGGGPTGLTFGGVGGAPKLVDGSLSDVIWFPNHATDVWVEFDFLGISKVINEAKWYQSDATTHGSWKFQGWDGGAWVDIGVTFVLGGSTIQTISTISANVSGYTKYRILASPGDTSFNPFIREMEFKIDNF